MSKLTKNQRISKTQKETKQRRSKKKIQTIRVKIDKSHAPKNLKTLFIEAKWMYNHTLSNGIFDTSDKITTVTVLNKDKQPEQRTFTILSSQMKQSIIQRMKQSVYDLSKMKKKGLPCGKLHFKSQMDSIPLKQPGITFSISKNHVKIQNIGKVRVRGLDQIPKKAEIASANLLNIDTDYYIDITYYIKKQKQKLPNRQLGIDKGITTQLTFSNGLKLNYEVCQTLRLKRLQQKLARQKLHSKNWYKTLDKIKHEYEITNNKKTDISNKICHYIKTHFNSIYMQNDNMKSWVTLYGKRVHKSPLGGITSGIKELPQTTNVDRWTPTTQICHVCGNQQKMALSIRTYHCQNCGHESDRDVNAAKSVIPLERRIKPDEEIATTGMMEYLNRIPHVSCKLFSMTQEALAL